MLVYCLYLLLLGGVVTPFTIPSSQHGLHSIAGGKMISWEPRTMISSEDFPCTKEGLYSHPTNCSRFYKCIDFTKERTIFSRYLYECPEKYVFAATIVACVPGVCPEHAAKLPDSSSGPTDDTGDVGSGSAGVEITPSVAPDGSSVTSAPGGTQTGGEAAGSGGDSTTAATSTVGEAGTTEKTGGQGEGGSVTEPTSSSGTTEKIISGLPPVIDQDQNVVQPEKIPGSTETCMTKYVQHERFCNLFHLCDDPTSLFSCYDGTAFSTERQMCRLSQFEEALCEGKEMFVPSAQIFRDAFNWKEVGVVPLDGNPVYNSNPYFFMNIGDGFNVEGFQLTPSVQPVKPIETSNPFQTIETSNPFQTIETSNPFQTIETSNPFQTIEASNPFQTIKTSKPFQTIEASNPFQTRFPAGSSRPRPQTTADTKERKRTRFSSLLSGISDIITGKRKPTSTKPFAPTPIIKTIVPKVTRKEEIAQVEKSKPKDTLTFDYAPFLNSFSDLSSFSDMLNTADPSQTSVSTSSYAQPGITIPFTGSFSNAAYSPFKGLGQSQSPYFRQVMQSQSPFLSQGIQSQSPFTSQGVQSQSPFTSQGIQSQSPFMSQGIQSQYPFMSQGIQSQSPFTSQGLQFAYASPSSVMYSPYAGMFPYAFSSPDISSIFRTPSSSPSNAFSQTQSSTPFSSSGSFSPYSPLFSSSMGMLASPYGFLYDPTRNSLIPVAIPPSYMNSLYASLLGANPYSNSLLQLSDKEAEQLFASALFADNKPAEKLEPKRKDTTTTTAKKTSKTKTPPPQKYPFLFNNQDVSAFSSLVPAFEARNENGETYQIVPLSETEVNTLAKQGLLERATKISKPFTYGDLENLQEGEVILTSFPKK